MTLTRVMMTLLVTVGLLAGACAEAAPPPEVSKKAALPTVRIGDVRNPPAATYLVICTDAAVEALRPLVARRAATGQTVRLATVQLHHLLPTEWSINASNRHAHPLV